MLGIAFLYPPYWKSLIITHKGKNETPALVNSPDLLGHYTKYLLRDQE
jgi:hypothetical protein